MTDSKPDEGSPAEAPDGVSDEILDLRALWVDTDGLSDDEIVATGYALYLEHCADPAKRGEVLTHDGHRVRLAEQVVEPTAEDAGILLEFLKRSESATFDVDRKVLMFGNLAIGSRPRERAR